MENVTVITDMKKLVPVFDVAQELGVSRRTVDRAIKKLNIKKFKADYSGFVYILVEDKKKLYPKEVV